MRKEDAPIMTSDYEFTGVSAAGMSRTLHAPVGEHPAHPAAATAAITAAPRKRRAAAGTTAASVNRGSI